MLNSNRKEEEDEAMFDKLFLKDFMKVHGHIKLSRGFGKKERKLDNVKCIEHNNSKSESRCLCA